MTAVTPTAHETPAAPTADELTAERAHLTTSRAALKAMRERAEQLFTVGDQVAGDAYTAEQLGRQMAQRIKELSDDPAVPLFFGKLTMATAGGEPSAGRRPAAPPGRAAGEAERWHIGRRHVSDAVGEPLVLDWRAPMSRRFYQASARDPQDVAVRRRFGWSPAAAGGSTVLTSFEDEHLDHGQELGTGSAILTAEIERPRVGPMRDIVATIQPEQDELVRADLEDTICVQGAPGTGKTAVGLHRAAYLVYLHRERLRRSGVLIIGPNRAFLHYISAVLPALGELEVSQATVAELLDQLPVRAEDGVAAATLKHDQRMAQVLHRALWARIARPTGPITVSDGSYRWRVDEGVLRRVVDEVRREQPPYALGRERVRARVVGLLQRQSEARRGDSPPDSWLRKMGKVKAVAELLDHCWPAVTPQQLLADLYTDAEARGRAADGLLTPEEQELLHWAKPPRSLRSAPWTAADAVLADEVAGLLDRPAGFGHIVIDEAQDLSPMQARALARRTGHGSLTVLGDLAQGTTPWAARDWRDLLGHLGRPDGRIVPLSTGFRVPAAVVALANRLLPALDVAVPPARSLRRDGSLEITESADVVAAARTALTREGSVGVIAADAAARAVLDALLAAGLEPSDLDGDGRLTVVPATMVKGLEYDHVIVCEPAAIVAAEPRGLHRLYVALTRAVTSLIVLHTEPLPEPLRA
ncbi:HelD family protein [Catellatospora chokoriensis]|uniref:DNA helicase n=1 Tax=Catellatospora chokoriensis TaxID=310353 RepID=A0A8J3NSI2_9ACTN|nr:AAA family ATPase [Catellatospora chokoriensis]GIF90553.1 DNA helicase [Catellatospora chokoriensis]